MNYDRMALAFCEARDDLAQLRLILDDTLDQIAMDREKISADTPEHCKERQRLALLSNNLQQTRRELSNFRALCDVRIDECSPGLLDRLARESTAAF